MNASTRAHHSWTPTTTGGSSCSATPSTPPSRGRGRRSPKFAVARWPLRCSGSSPGCQRTVRFRSNRCGDTGRRTSMCDYCGCRAHDAIASLSVEHETLLGMLSELLHHVDTHDAAAARLLLEQLHDALTPHALREEHGVFAELEHAGIDHTYIDMFQHDH